MKYYTVKLGIRTSDIDGNKIDQKQQIALLCEAINGLWNVAEYHIENENGSMNKYYMSIDTL